jgi:hypothetical protein
MSARRSRRTAAAIVLAAAVTALAPALANAAAPSTARVAVVNGTKGNGLTISNGSPYVVMNGTVVDFHTDVRDLAWNPTGTKAAFIDSNGNLETANPNGTDRVIVAKNPGNQAWSHPTWQTIPTAPLGYYPNGSSLIFVAAAKGVDRLETVPITAVDGKPTLLTLNSYFGEGIPANPTTANNWPNSGNSTAAQGAIVYDNTHNGEVYIRDTYLRQMGGAVTKGSEPAMSPNGEEVAFVRSVAGHDHIFEGQYTQHGFTVRDLTPHATTDYTEPTFSANGQTIAFRAANGTYTIPASGTHTPVKVSGYTGLAAYRG